MIGLPELTETIVATLSPLIPYLAGAGALAAKSFAEGVGKAGGEAAWKTAVGLWERLRGAAADDAKLTSAISLVEADPEDQDSIALFSKTLEAHLAKDELLRESLVRAFGGELAVQKMIAERGSRISGSRQDLQGSAEQVMTASDNSTIENATQQARR
jgi:hypothetical protein